MKQVETPELPKFRQVFDRLCAAIEAGVWVPGVRMPSERALAAEYGVNVATLRRAFRDLISGGMVEKRIGDGTYVIERGTDNFGGTINFILSDYDGGMHHDLIRQAEAEAARQGFDCRVVHSGSAELVMRLRTVIRFRQPTVILGDSLLDEAALTEMRRAPELFVVLAVRFDHLGIPSVVGNDYAGIHRLVDHLTSLGHRRIALLYNGSGHPTENIQLAVWRASSVGGPELELRAGVPGGEPPMHYAFDCIRHRLTAARATALIALNDELAVGAIAGAVEMGLRVPETFSIVAIGDSVVGRFANPPLTGLNPNLAGHLHQAFELLRRNGRMAAACDLLRIVEPELVERASVAPFRGK